MKNNILLVFIVILIAACNNPSSDKKPDGKTTAAEKEAAVNSSSSNCSNLILFQKGAVIEGASYDATGKVTTRQVTIVKEIDTEGDVTVANVDMQMNAAVTGSSVIKASYKCDGSNLYVDLNSLMSNFSALSGTKTEATPISFPVNITAGQTLPDASFTVTTDRSGKVMKITTRIKDRKVETKESVTTTAGTWDCYKVSSTMDSDVKMEGMGDREQKIADMIKKTMPVMRSVMWFAPDFGIVKMETYNNNKLTGRSEITAYKK